MRVLFIEDHVFAAKLKDWLNDHGYDVHRAENLLEANELLETIGNFDAAIVDLDLDKNFLSLELHKEAFDQYGGWMYYRHTLCKIPPLDTNTIILSALINDFVKTVPKEELTELILVDKRDSEFHQRVLEALQILKEKQEKNTRSAP